MEFDPRTQTLRCPGCGTSIEITNDREKIQEHAVTREARRTIRAGEKTSHTMICQGCGAKVEVEATSTAAECPYCGSKYVLADKQEDVIVPDGVVPFRFDKKEAGIKFQEWVKGRFWAPGELKHLYQKDRLQGIYIPYWTFDAQSEGDYMADGGIRHVQTYKNSKGETQTRTYMTWHPVSGHIGHFFDDVLIPASRKLDEGLLKDVDQFDTREVASYAPEYFSGYASECFTVSLDEAYIDAHREMERRLEDFIRSEVLARYDDVRNIRMTPFFSAETFKHILLPVYTTAYKYKDEVYHVLMNGQTGQIEGEYPKSIFKIALCILIILAAAGLVFYFIG